MKLIFRRFSQLFIFLVMAGIGQQIVVRAESSVINQINYSNKSALRQFVVKFHAKQTEPTESAKLNNIIEETETEDQEVESSKITFLLAFFGNTVSNLIVSKENEMPNSYGGKSLHHQSLKIYIILQVFRI